MRPAETSLPRCAAAAAGIPARRGRKLAALLMAILLAATAVRGEAPRWVTGPPYFSWPYAVPVAWYTGSPLYFTDPGDLSSYVNHAAADAMVAAAAGVWNVPTAAMEVSQGGELAEHVSGANSYLGSSGPVFPADVASSNYAAIQIAVIYDSDGSVTDMLLGGGASAPAECRQNGVTESVDAITTGGQIQHAILIVNGRCTGALAQQQLQLQYQLERAFGRILGVGWSQTNDNVFTRSPAPTYLQSQYWPIMHPIDIICGQYTYLCMPQPFTLRDDDVAAITEIYPYYIFYGFPATPPAPGKQWSFERASQAEGTITFPDGQGMAGVNVVYHREAGGQGSPQPFEDVSSVTGYGFQENAGNPVTGGAAGLSGSFGSNQLQTEGYFFVGWIPDIDPPGSQNGPMLAEVSTEAINPLYIGAHSVGPYVAGSVEPSGAAESVIANNQFNVLWVGFYAVITNFAPPDAASGCASGGDGTESAPAVAPATGWWKDVLCGYGHDAWSSFNMQAGRTATVEVTALDEQGLATTAKAMPLLGAWALTDATGTLPTLAATPSAFNTTTLGMTATRLATGTTAEGLRLVVADARGDGRPDFAYQARVLYADSVLPATVSPQGGEIVISGRGFRAGNEVLVNGIVAQVASWTATTIVAVAPSQVSVGLPEFHASLPAQETVDVAVVDLSTGGSTVMSGALTYSNAVAPDILALVSAPSGTVLTGASSAFSVRVTLGDGATPVAGLPVTFSASGGGQLAGCTGSPCIAVTDLTGVASAQVTATAIGAITLQASAVAQTVTASFNAAAVGVSVVRPAEYLAAGATVAWTPQLGVTENGVPEAGAWVSWTGSAGMVVTPAASQTNGQGVAQTSAVSGPLAAGVQAAGQACTWTTVCASYAAIGVGAAQLRVSVVSGAGQSVADGTSFVPVVLLVTDTAGHPVAGAPVSIYQTVDAVNTPCPVRGSCPIAPVLAKSQAGAVSDANGLLSVTAMQMQGVGEVTNVAAAAGTQGFVALSLDQAP